MPTTPLLGITQVSASQNQKEVTINDAIQALENATNKVSIVDFGATATKALSTASAQGSMVFKATNANAAATLTFPSTVNAVPFVRLLVVRNDCGHMLTVKYATGTGSSVTIPNGEGRLLALMDGTNIIVAAEPQSGASFLNLSDTPASYAGHEGKVLAIKTDASGVEFISFTGYPDTTGQGGKILAVKSDGSGVEWIANTGGSGGGGNYGSFLGGALVTKAGDQLAVNGQGAGVAIPWNTKTGGYDTHTAHDTVTNNTRITVPAGVTKARITTSLRLANVAVDAYVACSIRKNGGTAFVGGVVRNNAVTEVTSPTLHAETAIIDVIPGDYFEVIFMAGADNSIDILAANSWFAAEWITFSPAMPQVITNANASSNLSSANAGKYQRFTFNGAKTLTVQPDATAPMPVDAEWHIRNANTGNLTITAGSGVTINAPYLGTLVVPPQGSVTLKRVALDTWDLMGATVAA